MPEMATSCGHEFTVLKRVDKVNDRVDRTGLRRMTDSVILTGNRCSGTHHGGCRALCQSIWKEAWLVHVSPGESTGDRLARFDEPRRGQSTKGGYDKMAHLERTCGSVLAYGELHFRCQQTELKKASSFLSFWDARRYWRYRRYWRSGNVAFGEVIRAPSARSAGLSPDLAARPGHALSARILCTRSIHCRQRLSRNHFVG